MRVTTKTLASCFTLLVGLVSALLPIWPVSWALPTDWIVVPAPLANALGGFYISIGRVGFWRSLRQNVWLLLEITLIVYLSYWISYAIVSALKKGGNDRNPDDQDSLDN
jgi:hypothetical protein